MKRISENDPRYKSKSKAHKIAKNIGIGAGAVAGAGAALYGGKKIAQKVSAMNAAKRFASKAKNMDKKMFSAHSGVSNAKNIMSNIKLSGF